MSATTRLPALVHGSWTADWFRGEAGFADPFGPPPSEAALTETAERLVPHAGGAERLRPSTSGPVPPGALVVLAGQQPVLGGGPLLVAHKAATAIALARRLEALWERPVIPVFLLATEDHDSSEVDHLDVIDPSNGSLMRIRCPILPKHEMFARCHWDAAAFEVFLSTLTSIQPYFETMKTALKASAAAHDQVAEHIAQLLETTFASRGLRILEAHRLTHEKEPILSRALERHDDVMALLGLGARALEKVHLPISFRSNDPRPLVMESAQGRRRRLAAGDREAPARLGRRPQDFSPQAALRPIVQAGALPVVAQVCGPSELLYLGQSRGLHDLFEVQPPVLVPRLEATRLPAGLGADALLPATDEGPEQDLLAALARFDHALRDRDPSLGRQLERFSDQVTRGARRLSEALSWRGKSSTPAQVRPRGRFQDMVLAWAPDAWSHAQPEDWGRTIVELCRPLDPPAHVLHSYPEEPSDG